LPVATGKVTLPRNVTAAPAISSAQKQLARRPWYQGYVDEVAFYPKALSSDRIAGHANALKPAR